MTITEDIQDAILQGPGAAPGRPAYDGDGQVRRRRLGRRASPACSTCPPGRPGCGSSSARNARTPARSCGSPTSTATGSPAFATDAKRGQLADLELRHRRRARCEDRIRCAKDTGLRNLPLHGFAQNQIWCEIVALACELLAWMQMLALTGHSPPLGTQTAPAAPVLRRRAPRPRRPPPAAPPRRALALGPRHHRRGHPPAGPPVRLTSRNHPCDQEGATTRARGTPPTRRDSRAASHGPHLKISHQPNASGQHDRHAKDRG